MNRKLAMQCVGALSFAIATTFAQANDTTAPANTTTTQKQPTGKQKATAIGAATGAVAGAVVGGPVGAVVGAGVGGYVGHEGTDANGKVTNTDSNGRSVRAAPPSDTVRNAQTALSDQGYGVAVDGQYGPATRSAVMKFQADHGLAQTGMLDDATLTALKAN